MSNRRFAIIILTFFAALLAFAAISSLTSCTPERKLKRLLKKHPELVKSDTIWKTDFDTIPEIRINTVFTPDTSTKGLDSIFALFDGKIDSALAMSLKTEVRNYIINRPILPDTMYSIQNGVTVKIFQSGDQIGVIVIKPQEIVKEQIPVTVNKVESIQHRIRDYLPLISIAAMLVIAIFITRKRTKD